MRSKNVLAGSSVSNSRGEHGNVFTVFKQDGDFIFCSYCISSTIDVICRERVFNDRQNPLAFPDTCLKDVDFPQMESLSF